MLLFSRLAIGHDGLGPYILDALNLKQGTMAITPRPDLEIYYTSHI